VFPAPLALETPKSFCLKAIFIMRTSCPKKEIDRYAVDFLFWARCSVKCLMLQIDDLGYG
jgi:hypothetical protein